MKSKTEIIHELWAIKKLSNTIFQLWYDRQNIQIEPSNRLNIFLFNFILMFSGISQVLSRGMEQKF